ncbi:phenylalanine--tRNA ligase subunit beta [Telmatospirillum siberiense]|uniref:Phenylalanine--tRNA ligase beta subunit n=1 Tax=Telmatospirillum siberiense TaxID=382514 RepID=A0A2N3PQR2_9PROT|nr:phenylalanine--tRNA ligase subunit beta [Telmatospirillum siberiense]PKU22743.1 phenylalanine--tRNA ligase subunit beta [Telmatospirillum siberiense]
MKFTLSWLKRHLDTTAGVDAIAERLTMLGLEVESLDDPAARLGGFITGQVMEAGPHPNADRLQLCKVSIGRETLQVVCGAPNARAGLKVVVALPGVVVPATGEALKKGNVRGVESQAMMCSWRELLLGEDHSGIIELPSNTPAGEPLTKVLSFDPVIDVAITPNRADCLGVRGIARDLAAAGLGKLKPLSVEPVKSSFTSPIGVSLDFPAEAPGACSLFAGRTIRGVRNGESPGWLKDWLTAVGLRPISALVDITNYFTIDLDRPLHVFDAAKLKGDVRARLARDGETLAALNGKSYDLDGSMTVIADDAGPQALGGVIGGEATSVSAGTTDVFLEAALFDPMRTAATGRRLAIESDARYRFERGIDPAFVVSGMELATRMIIELCGGEASQPVIVGKAPAESAPITFRPHRVEQLGGVSVPEEAMVAALEALGCKLSKVGTSYAVVPPSWRADVTGEHDLVEEVIRIHGYDHIPTVSMPRPSVVRPVLTAAQRQANWVRRGLAARGLVETVTWSFLPSSLAGLFGGGKAELTLANPISSDLDSMRPSVLANLVAAAGRNADRGFRDISLFELGPEFNGDQPGDQRLVAAGIRAGRAAARHWAEQARPVDAFDAKADAAGAVAAAGGPAEGLQVVAEAPAWYHPGRSGSLKLGPKTVIASFGEIHPRVLAALDIKGPVVGFEVFLEAVPLPKVRPTKAKSLLKVSPFHAIERDFAFVVDRSVSAEAVLRAAKGADKALISDVLLFDLYEGPHVGEDKKSLAIQVTLQPVEKTLTDAEIEAIAAKVVDAVGKATGGELRG